MAEGKNGGSSPNLRLKDDTNEDFHHLQAMLMQDLRVGSRGVTADILVAALLDLGVLHYAELILAVEDQRERRGKGKPDEQSERPMD